jgi:hypothetical protein
MRKHTDRILKTIFASMPKEALEAYEQANAARGTTAPLTVEVSEPTRPTPEVAQAVIDKARKNLSDEFLAAMKAVRGLK